ncbi:hypothetical protein PIB30_048992 [Stylosanthes scabra]|uniref:FAR1 domain-containing protein n=1 Tax=Stylosanthes scabra TaxID=79078 RepID=A0ABU6YIC0_9FABA|nr:hypothetical protein [Stylosanthes scabra]
MTTKFKDFKEFRFSESIRHPSNRFLRDKNLHFQPKSLSIQFHLNIPFSNKPNHSIIRSTSSSHLNFSTQSFPIHFLSTQSMWGRELHVAGDVAAIGAPVTEQPTTDHHVDPEEGMCFGTLEEARNYYQRYAETVGFVIKIRNTNWETRNGDRVPINQSLHCNKDGYRVSRVKPLERGKTVASVGCGARCHISFDKTCTCWKISIRTITLTSSKTKVI